jgi:hypothetical protein
MALYWEHMDSDGNTVVTVQHPAIRIDGGLLKWAREVPNMHGPHRIGDRLVFTPGKGTQIEQLLGQVASHLGVKMPVLGKGPELRLIDTTDADLGQFESGATSQSRGGTCTPPSRALILLASR